MTWSPSHPLQDFGTPLATVGHPGQCCCHFRVSHRGWRSGLKEAGHCRCTVLGDAKPAPDSVSPQVLFPVGDRSQQ